MNVNQVVRTLTIRSKTEGVQQSAAELNKLSAAQDNVASSAGRMATVTEMSSKRQLSTAEAYRRQTLALDENARAQDKMARATRVADRALHQGAITQAEYARRLILINQAYGQVGTGARAFGSALQAANDNVRSFAQNAGTLGSIIAALGPAGIAAAAGIGAAVLALTALVRESARFADEMGKLRDTSQIVGLTTAQLQALNDAGAEFALTPDKIATGLQRFTAQLEEARRGEGELFAQLQRLDPQLALQFARTRDTASALELYAKAIERAGAAERAALSRAGLGRGGFDVGQMLATISRGGGLDALTEDFRKSGDAIDQEMIEKVRRLKREIDDMAEDARNNFASIFTVPVLEAQHKFYETMRDISRATKEGGASSGLLRIIELLSGSPHSQWLSLIPILQQFVSVANLSASLMPAPSRSGGAPTQPTSTFAERFQPAVDRPLTQTTQGKLDAQAVALDLAMYRQRIALLGESATAAERFTLRQKEINAAVAQNADLQGDANRALADAQQQFQLERMQATVSALGGAATATEQLSLRIAELQQQLSRGAISQETFNRAVADLKQDHEVTALRNNISALGNAATATEQYKLRVAELKQQLNRGQITQVTFNRAVEAAEPIMQQARSAAEQFGQSLASSLLDGVSLTDSLKTSLDSLAKSMASSAIQSLFKGDFMMAAVQTVIAVGSKIASGLFNDEEAKAAEEAAQALQEAKEAFADMATDITQFNAAAAGFDVSELASDLLSLTEQMRTLGSAALKAREFDDAERIGETFNRGVGRIIDEYLNLNTALSESGEAIRQAESDALSMRDALEYAGKSMHDASVIAEQGLAIAISRIRVELTQSLNEDINTAQGRGFINDISALVTEFNQLNAEGNADPALIARHFAAMAQSVIEDSRLMGDGFNELITLFPDLAGRVHESTLALEEQTRTVEETARQQAEAAQQLADQLNTSAGNIVNYVAGLQGGSQSTLSPAARLAAAQATYNATFTLAQANNIDALNRITQDFENLRTAARDVYGSGAPFQQILAQGIQQLLTLPAVATSDDPVVNALRDVQLAVNATTTAVGGTTTAVGGATGAIRDDTTATVSKLDTAIARLDTSIVKFGEIVSALSTSIERLTTGNTILDQTKTLTQVSRDQLQLLNSQLAGDQSVLTSAPGGAGGLGSANVGGVSVSNTMLRALNKIVANTKIIADLLQGFRDGTAPTGVPAPTYAFGGWITGGRPGVDSVRLASGGLGMPGEYVVRRDVAQANPHALSYFNATGHWPANDNGSAIEAKLDKLIQVLANVGAALVNAENMSTAEIRNVGATIGSAVNEAKRETRHQNMNPRNGKAA